jgi:PTH1 family peptidyl-tRNA hydrolase
MRLIVGLGNPGAKYQMTRHNLGFMAVMALAKEQKADFHKCGVSDAQVTKVTIGSQVCVLSMPQGYMNNSGAAVKAQAAKAGIGPEHILIVYDDMAIGFGELRIRPEGSAGGHNGIKSIIEYLGTKEFPRLRLGIGRPKPGADAVDYVLNNFTPGERKALPDIINDALLCVHSWVDGGVEKTMNQFNSKSKDKPNKGTTR